MDTTLWQEKAGARYMYYVCTESGVATGTDPLTPPPSLSLIMSLSLSLSICAESGVATGTDPLTPPPPPSLSLRFIAPE